MGFSVSCKTAVKYAAKYPDGVAKLVLTCGNPTLTRSANQADLIAFIQNKYEEAMRSYMRRCFPEPDSDWQHDLLVSIALKSNPFVAVSILKNYYMDDIEPLLSKINMPTLIMHGDKDDVYPIERAYRFQELIPNSVLHVHKDKGHLPNLTDIEVYNTTVEKFLLEEG
jgi:pimeloyl-ACP methyl ester carboxylesterase